MVHRGRSWMVALCAGALAAVPVIAQAAEEAAAPGGGGGSVINLDRSLLVQMVNFLILLVILYRLLYKPFLAKMAERTQAIKQSLDEAQQARAQAARQQEENEARLRQAYGEAARIREEALREAAVEQRRLVEGARSEAERLVETARARTEADIRHARDALRREVADLATTVAETLMRRSLRDDDHRRIVDDAIAKLGSSR